MEKLFPLLILLIPLITMATDQKVLINEIAWMGTLQSANAEWIELYNPTDKDIDLEDWKLEAADGTPKINLSGIIPAGSYFLLERTNDESLPEIEADLIYSGALGNNGEWLKLYDSKNNLVDQINASEKWPGGNNTTKQTLERSDSEGWQTSKMPQGTPKAKNSNPEIDNYEENNEPTTPLPIENETLTVETKTKKGDIVINEIFPDPPGIDLNDEFIEIKNISKNTVNLTGWIIKNSAGQEFIIPSLIMSPSSIVAFFRPETGIALNNKKDKIILYSTSKIIIDQIEYKSTAPENKSLQRNNQGKLVWDDISPRKENLAKIIITPTAEINGPAQAKINEFVLFDASDSSDPDNRQLEFIWNFGNGRTDKGIFVRQIYFKPGTYEVVLKAIASDSASSTQKLKIKISDGYEKKEVVYEEGKIPLILITEFLPYAVGADNEEEFIEIFSQESAPFDLSGYKLDDQEGQSKPFIFPEGTIIKPGEYKAFFSKETKIALNNNGDEVRFLTPDDKIIDQAEYQKSKKGVSYVLDENFNWQESKNPTPGQENILDEDFFFQIHNDSLENNTLNINYIPFIFITEFLPYAVGADNEEEFIEIFSQESAPFDLSGYKLDDQEGQSKPFIFPEGTIIKPGEYKAFFSKETKIALNNNGDEVRLLTPDDKIIDQAEYQKSKKGVSYVLDENFNWQQSNTPTPGEINVLNQIEEINDQKSEAAKEPKVLGAQTEEIRQNDSTKNKGKYIFAGVSALVIFAAFGISKLKSIKYKS